MKLWSLLKWLITGGVTLNNLVLANTGTLPGRLRSRSELETEFLNEAPLPASALNRFDWAVEAYNKGNYGKALDNFLKLSSVPWQGRYINLLEESITVTYNVYVVCTELPNHEQLAQQYKDRYDELTRQYGNP